jgi:hypothetical protein
LFVLSQNRFELFCDKVPPLPWNITEPVVNGVDIVDADIVVAEKPPVIILLAYNVQLAVAFNPHPNADE